MDRRKNLLQFAFTGAAGFEPATRDLEGRYSIQLSYAPNGYLT